MNIQRIVVGPFATNCYLVIKEGQIVVIDPGAGFNKIVDRINQYENHHVVAILLTHGHFDHIGALDKLQEKYHCPVFASQDDEKMIRNDEYNSLGNLKASANCQINWLKSNKLKVGIFDFDVYYTPGHTEGSVVYKIDDNLFTGDTLFKNSVGRTDLYSGSNYKLLQSLEIFTSFSNLTMVYPGHDDITTIGYELQNNPFLKK